MMLAALTRTVDYNVQGLQSSVTATMDSLVRRPINPLLEQTTISLTEFVLSLTPNAS